MPVILQRIVAVVLGVVALVAAFTFALVALLTVTVIGLAAWGWLRWKARGRPVAHEGAPSSRVIDAEVVVVEEPAPRIGSPDKPAP